MSMHSVPGYGIATRDAGQKGDLQWFAIQTRPRHEKSVTTQL